MWVSSSIQGSTASYVSDVAWLSCNEVFCPLLFNDSLLIRGLMFRHFLKLSQERQFLYCLRLGIAKTSLSVRTLRTALLSSW